MSHWVYKGTKVCLIKSPIHASSRALSGHASPLGCLRAPHW
jgi:hypothetical protein